MGIVIRKIIDLILVIKYILHQDCFPYGLSNYINISKITPSLRYGLMSLVFLSNNGKYKCSQ